MLSVLIHTTSPKTQILPKCNFQQCGYARRRTGKERAAAQRNKAYTHKNSATKRHVYKLRDINKLQSLRIAAKKAKEEPDEPLVVVRKPKPVKEVREKPSKKPNVAEAKPVILKNVYDFKITSEDHGVRYDRFVQSKLKLLNFTAVQRLFRQRKIVAWKERDVKWSRVKYDDRIESTVTQIKVNGLKKPNAVSSDKDTTKVISDKKLKELHSWILYKDEHLIVINKPAELAVQGGTGITDSLDDNLDAYKFDGRRPMLVHRLDKGASGLLILARTKPVARELMLMWGSHSIKKLYWTVVLGVPRKLAGTLSCYLAKVQEGNDEQVRVVQPEEAAELNAKMSSTIYHTLTHIGQIFSVLAMKPATGRTHQLRVHCASLLNTPMLGDTRYGPGTSEELYSFEQRVPLLHLHARELAFKHPVTQELKHFVAPLPEHFLTTFKTFGVEMEGLSTHASLTDEDRRLEKKEFVFKETKKETKTRLKKQRIEKRAKRHKFN